MAKTKIKQDGGMRISKEINAQLAGKNLIFYCEECKTNHTLQLLPAEVEMINKGEEITIISQVDNCINNGKRYAFKVGVVEQKNPLSQYSEQELMKEIERRKNEELKKEYDHQHEVAKFVQDNREVFEKFYALTNVSRMEFPKEWDIDSYTFSLDIRKFDIDKFYNGNGKLRWE